MNPPYNGPGQQNFLCRRITKEIKSLKPQKYIQICPNEANLSLWENDNDKKKNKDKPKEKDN